MLSASFYERMHAAFTPPRYLAFPLTGIDLSTSGVKAVRLSESMHGLTCAAHAEVLLPAGAFADGEVVDRPAVVEALKMAAEKVDISAANVALSESKSYLFEAEAQGKTKNEQRVSIEQHLDEIVPIPPAETIFDFVSVGSSQQGSVPVAGIGFARRIVNETLAAFDEAGIEVRALEAETFAASRALLPHGDESTALIIDIGKTTTKVSVVSRRIPLFATTIDIGGHPFTLAVQKYFGVTESEARKVKAERGIIPDAENKEYLDAMLKTAAAIREEIARHLEYWQGRAKEGSEREPVTKAILVGGNASVRGLPEYLEGTLHIPVTAGDVFTNLASRDVWIPDLTYAESLAYATAIGLALRDHIPTYE